jgi:phytoene dehydrogenase-like protein
MPVFPALADDAATLGGRILIAPTLDYLERAFDATKYGEISQEPWLEISIPSVRDDSLAPAECARHVDLRALRPLETCETWTRARRALPHGPQCFAFWRRMRPALQISSSIAMS